MDAAISAGPKLQPPTGVWRSPGDMLKALSVNFFFLVTGEFQKCSSNEFLGTIFIRNFMCQS